MIKQMDDTPDAALVKMAIDGSSAAFSELVRRHQQRIYQLVLGMTRNHLDADDLSQEVFLSAFRSLRRFNRNSSFYTWIYRIAMNKSLNFLKKRGKEKNRAEFAEDMPGADRSHLESSAPENMAMKKELRNDLEEAVTSLPGLLRAAFLLVVNQDLSHSEAAEILGCSENTVAWRMHKARKILRSRLHPAWAGKGTKGS
jgi:RNA polymerase sigma-70 factor (ECF subfamily)